MKEPKTVKNEIRKVGMLTRFRPKLEREYVPEVVHEEGSGHSRRRTNTTTRGRMLCWRRTRELQGTVTKLEESKLSENNLLEKESNGHQTCD